MKDFDIARREREQADRSFLIGGSKFVFRAAVAPESILGWSELSGSAEKEQAALDAARAALRAKEASALAKDEKAKLEADADARAIYEAEVAALSAEVAAKTEAVAVAAKPETEWLHVIDLTVTAIIEPDYHDAWKKVRDPEQSHPLSLGDLQALLEWLMEQVTGRPTGQPSASSPSDGNTSTGLTAVSSSPEERELAGSASAN